MKNRLNFSPQPFRDGNSRLMLLWVLNLILLVGLGGTVWYWNNLRSDNQNSHQRLDNLREQQSEIAENFETTVELLEDVDLKNYRKQMQQYHGIQSAFDTRWGQLLDDLSELMGPDVRLISLRPKKESGRKAGDATLLYLTGEARVKAAQLELIRTLQGAKGFDRVRFEAEYYEDGEVALRFEISFTYKPQGGA